MASLYFGPCKDSKCRSSCKVRLLEMRSLFSLVKLIIHRNLVSSYTLVIYSLRSKVKKCNIDQSKTTNPRLARAMALRKMKPSDVLEIVLDALGKWTFPQARYSEAVSPGHVITTRPVEKSRRRRRRVLRS